MKPIKRRLYSVFKVCYFLQSLHQYVYLRDILPYEYINQIFSYYKTIIIVKPSGRSTDLKFKFRISQRNICCWYSKEPSQ